MCVSTIEKIQVGDKILIIPSFNEYEHVHLCEVSEIAEPDETSKKGRRAKLKIIEPYNRPEDIDPDKLINDVTLDVEMEACFLFDSNDNVYDFYKVHINEEMVKFLIKKLISSSKRLVELRQRDNRTMDLIGEMAGKGRINEKDLMSFFCIFGVNRSINVLNNGENV